MAPTDRHLLDLIGDAGSLVEIDDFHPQLLDALKSAVPSDWVAINEIGPGPEMIMGIVKPPIPQEQLDVFARYADQNPLLEHYQRTRDGRARRISDLVGREEFHSRQVYTEFYGPLGLEFQMAFVLPAESERVVGVILSRRHEDFTDDERDLVERARPFLIQAYRNSLRYTEALAPRAPTNLEMSRPRLEPLQALGLSLRQAEVLQLLATGASESDIAKNLGISLRTVHKHLQLCYRTLGVERRSSAAAIAWSTLDKVQAPDADDNRAPARRSKHP
jgi:DNA-binding CsgD family transcriptional regulator